MVLPSHDHPRQRRRNAINISFRYLASVAHSLLNDGTQENRMLGLDDRGEEDYQ